MNWLQKLRYKKWDFFDVVSDEYIIQVAVANLGYAGNI